jgi:hypothetical protein
MEVEIDQVHRFDDVLYDDSRLRLPDQLHQPRAYLEPDVPALAAALAHDPTNLAAALRGAGFVGMLEPIWERIAAV